MAQAATMGPPMSPREPRRSGRRSAPSASTSNSKSPDSDTVPKTKDVSHRQILTSTNTNSRNKRLKQEDSEDGVEDRKHSSAPNAPNHTNGSSNRKRKAKDKEKHATSTNTSGENQNNPSDEATPDAQEEEEQGITRCICGSTGEDDPDAGEFMVQCETCKVWQHGLCMGYESEDQLHDDDYYCEECRPAMHAELLRKLNRRPRHSSATNHPTTTTHASRLSRSHSPTHVAKQPSKRRNTMNSRDAAFDESLKEIMEATAAEAAAQEMAAVTSTAPTNPPAEAEDEDANSSGRKKRKRTEDDAPPKKRTRSASTASDRPHVVRDETPTAANNTTKVPPQAPAPKPSARNKRGGRKQPTVESANGEGEEVPANKRQSNNNRNRSAAIKRPPASNAVSQSVGSISNEPSSRRSQTSTVNGAGTGTNTSDASRAYKNSHAYVVSQQPLYTSWGLPDYLGHLEQLLPTDIPRPLEVLSGPGVSGLGHSNGQIRGDSIERTTERGVKVKWPSKRMSVGDMNKRVRALFEWVGREQANAQDRGRRREALELALKEEQKRRESQRTRQITDLDGGDVQMIDQNHSSNLTLDTGSGNGASQDTTQGNSWDQGHYLHPDSNGLTTMQLMEQLMEELIGFQERFGPGAKNRDRERRTTAVVS